jgi:two-component system response regulator YesN
MRETGAGVRSAIISSRMKRAARLLLDDSERKIFVVASECGYASESSFIHVFAKVHGLSPSSYRHTARENPIDGAGLP